MYLFAFRRLCPAVVCGVSGKQKKDNPLRSLRLCGELSLKSLCDFISGEMSELAEGARLEIVCAVKSGTEGSNPSLSAIKSLSDFI